MNKYKAILFDLDGTLTDPKVGITKCVQYALKKMGIVVDDLNELEPFIGPPLQESFSKIYSFDEEQTKLAIEYYRERFKETGMFENEIYPGIIELLTLLKEHQNELVVATSKPTVFSEKILHHFNIDKYFNLVVGSNLDGTRTAKTEIIQYILDKYEDKEKHEFIMIGDRKHDIIGAKNTGIHSMGVSYGYGSLDELIQSNPTYIVHNVDSIKGKLLS
ncbi:HAD family hydrolase [Paenibacillus sp. KQZ6P-2]|uniref:HAD family hydrolase n=1 Tax=Paenibacillus mangrovi TaxID=2931978 RepID=A0A9X1WUM8_9BACL|nr:HAD family hydrolase [Paenibacillus mangrovi]